MHESISPMIQVLYGGLLYVLRHRYIPYSKGHEVTVLLYRGDRSLDCAGKFAEFVSTNVPYRGCRDWYTDTGYEIFRLWGVSSLPKPNTFRLSLLQNKLSDKIGDR
jgi:hypothetical protein